MTTPYAYGFESFNSLGYSGKEVDSETGNSYYGSRYYDPGIGLWNKQDSYRGSIQQPSTRNRYSFVNSNPVNNVDIYGFVTQKQKSAALRQKADQLSGLVNYGNMLNSAMGAINNFQRIINTGIKGLTAKQGALNAMLPGLGAEMNRTFWAAYNAEMQYYDHICMNGIIDRLRARGYEMNYANVYSYLDVKINQTGRVFAIKQAQANRAASNYYGTVGQINSISKQISGLSALNKALGGVSSIFWTLNTINNIKINGVAGDISKIMAINPEKASIKGTLKKGFNSLIHGELTEFVHEGATYGKESLMELAKWADQNITVIDPLKNMAKKQVKNNSQFLEYSIQGWQSLADKNGNNLIGKASREIIKAERLDQAVCGWAYNVADNPFTTTASLTNNFILTPAAGIVEINTMQIDLFNPMYYITHANEYVNQSGSNASVGGMLKYVGNDALGKVTKTDVIPGAIAGVNLGMLAVNAIPGVGQVVSGSFFVVEGTIGMGMTGSNIWSDLKDARNAKSQDEAFAIGEKNYLDLTNNTVGFGMSAVSVAGGLGSIQSGITNLKSATTITTETTDSPTRINSARELTRRVEESGPYHNFPESFDSEIFSSKPIDVAENYRIYTKPGTINGQSGVYEIGVRVEGNTEIIVHRFFNPD